MFAICHNGEEAKIVSSEFKIGCFVLDGTDLGVVVGYKNGSVDVQFPSRRAFVNP